MFERKVVSVAIISCGVAVIKKHKHFDFILSSSTSAFTVSLCKVFSQSPGFLNPPFICASSINKEIEGFFLDPLMHGLFFDSECDVIYKQLV